MLKTQLSPYDKFMKDRKEGESVAAACERLGVSQSMVYYHRSKAKTKKKKATKSPALATRVEVIDDTPAARVPAVSPLGPPTRQAVMLIGDPATLLDFLQKKGW